MCGWRTATAGSDVLHDAWVGVGTNLADRRQNLAGALREVGVLGTIEAISSVYESEPVGFAAQPAFWNLVLRLRTRLDPQNLLRSLKQAEQRLGRRPTFRYGPRIIDLDLLLFDDVRMSTSGLQLPHPRMLERAFVLRPLLELHPDLQHPGTGRPIADHLDRVRPQRAVPLFPGTDLLPPTTAGDEERP